MPTLEWRGAFGRLGLPTLLGQAPEGRRRWERRLASSAAAVVAWHDVVMRTARLLLKADGQRKVAAMTTAAAQLAQRADGSAWGWGDAAAETTRCCCHRLHVEAMDRYRLGIRGEGCGRGGRHQPGCSEAFGRSPRGRRRWKEEWLGQRQVEQERCRFLLRRW